MIKRSVTASALGACRRPSIGIARSSNANRIENGQPSPRAPGSIAFAAAAVFAAALSMAPVADGKAPGLPELDLEPSLNSAALVVAVRVDDVSPMQVVYGGKGAQTVYQYTFTPVRVLKGVYSRPELRMTSVDLQAYSHRFDPRDIRTDQYRLLMLGRSDVGYYGIHRGASAAASYPVLDGEDDPLVSAAEVLLAEQHENDRLATVSRLAGRLPAAEGRGAVLLIAALNRRSYIAAQRPPAFRAVSGLLGSGEGIVREAAANALRVLFEADYLVAEDDRRSAVAALVGSLEDPAPLLAPRIVALQALASAPEAVRNSPAAKPLMQFDRPGLTLAEQAARLAILGNVRAGAGRDAASAVFAYLDELPLDAPENLQRAAARAVARVARTSAAEPLLGRLREKKSLGLDGLAEISAFDVILADADDPWPVQREILNANLTLAEQRAFVRICEDSPSPQLVPALSGWLDPRNARLRRQAADLLMTIDSRQAAGALRPHLANETNLAYKLQIAEFLGRHGFDDGYAYALEHMSEPRHLEAAVQAIAAIDKPGSREELLKVYRHSNDIRWQQAAIRALGLLGSDTFKDELEALSKNPGHSLAPAALLARADMGDADVLDRLPGALASRNESLVVAAARAAAVLLAKAPTGDETATEIRGILVTLAKNAETPVPVRSRALEALAASGDNQLDAVLAAMIRDRALEQTDLLERVRELMRERQVLIDRGHGASAGERGNLPARPEKTGQSS